MKKDSENKIQSPEQIADHLRVTYVPTYLLAAAAALLLVAFIVWGILGNVSDKAYYSGVIFPVQGTTDITLPNNGIVRSMLVHNGDSVHEGQTIAMVSIGNSHSEPSSLPMPTMRLSATCVLVWRHRCGLPMKNVMK